MKGLDLETNAGLLMSTSIHRLVHWWFLETLINPLGEAAVGDFNNSRLKSNGG